MAHSHRRAKNRDKKLQKKRTRLRDVEAELTVEELAEFEEPYIAPGYVGKPKGSRMHTWIRGHWTKGLTHKQCCQILQLQPDFQAETSHLENWWIKRGHGAMKTITATPEAVEVEYDWGKSKFEFRNYINTKSTSVPVYRASVMKSLGRHPYISRKGQHRPPPIPRRRHWRFIRRANDYLRAYSLFDTPLALQASASASGEGVYAFIERSRRKYKSHRCVGEQQFKFTTHDDPNDQVAPQDDERCERYLVRYRTVISIDEQVRKFLE